MPFASSYGDRGLFKTDTNWTITNGTINNCGSIFIENNSGMDSTFTRSTGETVYYVTKEKINEMCNVMDYRLFILFAWCLLAWLMQPLYNKIVKKIEWIYLYKIFNCGLFILGLYVLWVRI